MTKIVCRLLTADNQLLGWVEHQAAIRGDGCLRSSGPVTIPVTTRGVAVCVSLHWADVNVETRIPTPVGLSLVQVGDTVTVFAADMPMVTLGKPPIGLPAVTVGSTRVGIPVGALGAKGAA